MGKHRFDSASYSASATSRAASGVSDTAYSDRAKSTSDYTVAADLNPAGKMRVSRDIAGRERKTPIIVAFDVTGSMASSPAKFQKTLPQLFGLLEYKAYCTDPDIAPFAFGDVTSDHAPIQFGSFNGGNEVDEEIRQIILEGNGGGHGKESPEMVLAFAAYRTKHDAMDKRGQKGYLFLCTDEKWRDLDYNAYNDYFKPEEPMTQGILFEQVLADARKLYNIFFIQPLESSIEDDYESAWRKHFDSEHFLQLEKAENISQLIAVTIGMVEGTVDWAGAKADLTATGGDLRMIGSIEKAVKVLPAAVAAATGLPDGKPTGTIKRLKA